MAPNDLLIIFVLYGFAQFFGLALSIAAFALTAEGRHDLHANCFLPYRLYKTTKMNWFGSWLCSILIFILLPVGYIMQVFWWLFHIGTNEKKK